MIGVSVREDEEEITREFFELFKTPWEFLKGNGAYDIVVDTTGGGGRTGSKATIVFSSDVTPWDEGWRCIPREGEATVVSTGGGEKLPLFGKLLLFEGKGDPLLYTEENRRIAGYARRDGESSLLRLGYDLFREIGHLLGAGQEKNFSRFPTADLHVLLLRNWILESGVPVVEIPPKPPGHGFIVCLTHDVDFYSVRKHFLDHTFLGFLYRGTIKTFMEFLRKRSSFEKVVANWTAVLLLPFVYLGLVRDYWVQFQRYRSIERDLHSTFFIVPFKNRAGIGFEGAGTRSTRYDIDDIESEIPSLVSSGFEIGSHGIDAWCDPDRGRLERERISRVSGQKEAGVRMHWLSLDGNSFQHLEKAGYRYDATVGYNDAAGFRAGTAQVFRPPGAEKLFELPLHIQDTALFYPDRMNLDEKEAMETVEDLVRTVARTGGVLTVNWHHRSLAPERLWGDFYTAFLGRLRTGAPWFATALEAVRWFEKRRSATFGTVRRSPESLNLHLSVGGDGTVPGLLLRIRIPGEAGGGRRCVDIPLSGNGNIVLSLKTAESTRKQSIRT
jgi:hypothetical protein